MPIMDFFSHWRQQSATDTVAEEEIAAEVDEPPDHHCQEITGFQKSTIRPKSDRAESLLTRALQGPEADTKPEIHVAADLSRRRSMISNTSLASTAELTSDGGLTSPARTNTPSPPLPRATYTSFAPYSLAAKAPIAALIIPSTNTEPAKTFSPEIIADVSVSPTAKPPVDAPPTERKRCITFACGGRKDSVVKPIAPPAPQPTIASATVAITEAPVPKRECKIKFNCPGNIAKPSTNKPGKTEMAKVEIPKVATTPKATETVKRTGARSPSMTRKSPRPSMPLRSLRDSSSSVRKTSRSPVAVRARAKYIDMDEKTLQSSEATRFHEFASGELQEDDWIRKESDNPRERLTINDTLKMENAIRRLGNEAEEEALEEDEEEEDEDGNDSDDENDSQEEDEDDQDSIDGSDEDASDGNETDNEAGFADSDEESVEGEFAFWTPGRNFAEREHGEATTYRASAHRTASASSIDSLNHMSPQTTSQSRRPRRRPIKIRPGTPDLPDSTDFVCGTLDEDRPLEDAYVSCMEARKFAKHKQTPQDIDPSFPTSEPEDEEDEHDVFEPANDSEENVWLHGKFEEDEEPHGRRVSMANRRKSPAPSPKRLRSPAPHGRRLHSPPPPARRMHSPPPKARLRSPPPRKLFGHSPKRMHSPPPARTVRSPLASPTHNATSSAIHFAPLGSRPGLTHTKSLPRTPNVFCRASQLAAANGNHANGSGADAHVRKAIDIVKGLERKRRYRKEKFYKGKGKNQPERRPLPGKGAERMREVGLHMAGKTGAHAQAAPYMLSA
jgi:hypothetical protein